MKPFKNVPNPTRVGLVCLLVLPFLGSRHADSVPGTASGPLGGANHGFTLGLLRRMAATETPPDNLVLSGHGLVRALAVARAGADGDTRADLTRLLRFPMEDAELLMELAELRNNLEEDAALGNVDFHEATSLWTDHRFVAFRDDFLQTASVMTGGEIHRVDFSNPACATGRINAWITEQTPGPQLGSLASDDPALQSRSAPGVVDEVAFVVVNVLRFKADWQNRFDPELTRDGEFWTGPDSPHTVRFMRQTSQFRHAMDDRFHYVELPYAGGEFSMHLLLPIRPLPVTKLVEHLDGDALQEISRQALPGNISLKIPKFEIRSELDAKPLLQELGMANAFDPATANFSRMFDPKPEALILYLEDVRQEALIEVHEAGTKAVAVTRVVGRSFGCSSAGVPAFPFHATHPFLYFITHNESQSLLFAGWVGKP